MSDPNEAFAASAAAAVAASQPQEQGASGEPGTEPAEVDPVSELAKTLQASGVTPETAREAVQTIAYMQTPKGKQEFWQNFLNSPDGQAVREQFGRDHLAGLLAQPDGPKKIAGLLKEWGVDGPLHEEDEVSPEQKEIRAMRQQQQALEARVQQLQQGNSQMMAQVKMQDDAKEKVGQFQEWTRGVPKMANEAYHALAKRAHELSALYPDKYRGPSGFKSAATDAYGEFTKASQYFQPKPRPRGLGPGSGGVTGGQVVDDSKLTPEQRLQKIIAATSEQFELDSRG